MKRKGTEPMIVKPSNFLKYDSRFKHWGKSFNANDFDESKEKGYALGGKFVPWNSSVALGPGQFLVVAAETGSRANHSYEYALVIGGDDAKVVDKTTSPWKDFIESMRKVFPEDVVAKAMNNTLYKYGLFATWMALQAEGGPEPEPVDLSKVDDETLAAELAFRGWCCEREPDGGHRPETKAEEVEAVS
jgi:hypothetical protein